MPRPRRKAATKAKAQISGNAPVSRGSKKKDTASSKAEKAKEDERNETESEDQREEEQQDAPATRRSGRRTTRKSDSPKETGQSKKARGGRKPGPKSKLQSKGSKEDSSEDEEEDSTPEETDASSRTKSKKGKGRASARKSQAKEDGGSSDSSSSENDDDSKSIGKKVSLKKKSQSSEKKSQVPKDDQSATSLTDASAGTKTGKQNASKKKGGRKSSRLSNDSESEEEQQESTRGRSTRSRKAAVQKKAPIRKSTRKSQNQQPSSDDESDHSEEGDTSSTPKQSAVPASKAKTRGRRGAPRRKESQDSGQSQDDESIEGEEDESPKEDTNGSESDTTEKHDGSQESKANAKEERGKGKSSSSAPKKSSERPRARRGKRDRQTPDPDTKTQDESSSEKAGDKSSSGVEARQSKRRKGPSAKISLEEGTEEKHTGPKEKDSAVNKSNQAARPDQMKTIPQSKASSGVGVEQEDLATAALMLALASGAPTTSAIADTGKGDHDAPHESSNMQKNTLVQDNDEKPTAATMEEVKPESRMKDKMQELASSKPTNASSSVEVEKVATQSNQDGSTGRIEVPAKTKEAEKTSILTSRGDVDKAKDLRKSSTSEATAQKNENKSGAPGKPPSPTSIDSTKGGHGHPSSTPEDSKIGSGKADKSLVLGEKSSSDPISAITRDPSINDTQSDQAAATNTSSLQKHKTDASTATSSKSEVSKSNETKIHSQSQIGDSHGTAKKSNIAVLGKTSTGDQKGVTENASDKTPNERKIPIDGDSEAAVASLGKKSSVVEAAVDSDRAKVASQDEKNALSVESVPKVVSIGLQGDGQKHNFASEKAPSESHGRSAVRDADVSSSTKAIKTEKATTNAASGTAAKLSPKVVEKRIGPQSAARTDGEPENPSKSVPSSNAAVAGSSGTKAGSSDANKTTSKGAQAPILDTKEKIIQHDMPAPIQPTSVNSECEADSEQGVSKEETSKAVVSVGNKQAPAEAVSQPRESSAKMDSSNTAEAAPDTKEGTQPPTEQKTVSVNQPDPSPTKGDTKLTMNESRIIISNDTPFTGQGGAIAPKQVLRSDATESRLDHAHQEEKETPNELSSEGLTHVDGADGKLQAMEEAMKDMDDSTTDKNTFAVPSVKNSSKATTQEGVASDMPEAKAGNPQIVAGPPPSGNNAMTPPTAGEASKVVEESEKSVEIAKDTQHLGESEFSSRKVTPEDGSVLVTKVSKDGTGGVLNTGDSTKATAHQEGDKETLIPEDEIQQRNVASSKKDVGEQDQDAPDAMSIESKNELSKTQVETKPTQVSSPAEDVEEVGFENSLTDGEIAGIQKDTAKLESRASEAPENKATSADEPAIGLKSITEKSDIALTVSPSEEAADKTPIPHLQMSEVATDKGQTSSKPKAATSTAVGSHGSLPVVVPEDSEVTTTFANKRENEIMKSEDSLAPPAKRVRVEAEEIYQDDESQELPEDTRPIFNFEEMKLRLYSEGSIVHRNSDFERIFANYWEGMRLRFDGINSSSKIERSRSMINQFLTTRKLRKLHNKMIKGLLGLCLRKKIPYDEISNIIPHSWRKKITISSEDPMLQALNIRKPLKSPRQNPTVVDAHGHVSEKLGYLPAIGGAAAKPYRHKQTSQTFLRIPGAFSIDSELKTEAHSKNMKVSETAVWAAVASAKEYASSILRGCVTLKKSMHNGRMKRPRPTNVPAPRPEKKAKKELNNQLPMDQRHISSFDIQAFVTTLPTGSVQYHGGAMSRNTYERTVLAAAETSFTPFGPAFYQLKEFIWDKLAPGYTMPVDFQKPKPLTAAPSASSRPRAAIGTNNALPSAGTTQNTVANAGEGAQEVRQKIQVGGLGRGAKNLASLKMRSSGTKLVGTAMNDISESDKLSVSSASKGQQASSGSTTEVGASQAQQAVAMPTKSEKATEDESKESGGVQSVRPKGKGFGIKDLAAMKARSDTPSKDD